MVDWLQVNNESDQSFLQRRVSHGYDGSSHGTMELAADQSKVKVKGKGAYT